jgi:hypothetical protein
MIKPPQVGQPTVHCSRVFILLSQNRRILSRLFIGWEWSYVLREVAYRPSIAFSINFQTYPGSLFDLLVIADSGLTNN